MAKKNKGLGVNKCCECCNNCTIYSGGTYICNKQKVIDGYMPTENYYWCKGEVFVKRVKEKGNDSSR
nr:MAG TPA: hypothetical protein [Caudoviricetes sp.]